MAEKQQAPSPPEKRPLEPPFDKVVSYTIHTDPDNQQRLEHYEKVEEALKQGFRVIDIIPVPANPQADGSAVVVTLMLTIKPNVAYKGYRRRKSRY